MGDGIEISLAETTDICSDEDNDNDSSSSRASDDKRQSSTLINADDAIVTSDMRRNWVGKEHWRRCRRRDEIIIVDIVDDGIVIVLLSDGDGRGCLKTMNNWYMVKAIGSSAPTMSSFN